MANKKNKQKKQRTKKQASQESSSAHGTMTDVRRNMAQSAGGTSMATLGWITLGLAAAALLWAVLAP